MLIVTGTIEIAEKDLDSARAAVTVMMRETQREDGCHVYEFSEVVGAPGRFRIYEEWADRAALEAHFNAPHMAVFRQALSQVDVHRRDIAIIAGGRREPLP